ncbi:MAG: 30S ribosomal protein S14 [Gammaproteobacteria bacterium]|nr:30S ribosomal protein S14 [Gammaproteobacteria bacterium]
MAKVCMIEREKKRRLTVQKYKAQRDALRQNLERPHTPAEEKAAAVVPLQKLPRNSSPSRMRNRCRITGRPKGYYRKFGLGRNKLREYAMLGYIPGLMKSSW